MMSKEEFLKDKIGSSSNHHKEYLGMEIPENYFRDSKKSILDLISKEEKTKTTPVFYLRRSFQVAASITLLIALTIWFQFTDTGNSDDLYIASDDVLIESLFIEDADMNQFVNDIVVSEIMVEAEKSEQELENIFINSLFVEDSLIDSYMKENLMDHIIL